MLIPPEIIEKIRKEREERDRPKSPQPGLPLPEWDVPEDAPEKEEVSAVVHIIDLA